MSFGIQIAEAIDGARHGAALDQLSSAIWKGLACGAIGDDEAQALAERIHAMRTIQKPADPRRAAYPVRKPQRAPVRAVAIERRRRLATSGPLPPSVAAAFTTGELAVLRIVADEVRDRGRCTLHLAAIAARAGVCRKLAQNAIRHAIRLGLLHREERRWPGRVSLPNVLTIVSAEWKAWIGRGPRSKGIGGIKIAPTDTKVSLREGKGAGRAPHTSRNRLYGTRNGPS